MRRVSLLCVPMLLWMALNAEESVEKDGQPGKRGDKVVTFTVRMVKGSVAEFLPRPAVAKKGVEVDEDALAGLLKKISTDRRVELFSTPRLKSFSGKRAEVSILSDTFYIADYDEGKNKDGVTIVDPILKKVSVGTTIQLAGVPRSDGGVAIDGQLKYSKLLKMDTHIFKGCPDSKKKFVLPPVEKPDVFTQKTDLKAVLGANRSLVFLVAGKQDGIEEPVYAILSATVADPPEEAPAKIQDR